MLYSQPNLFKQHIRFDHGNLNTPLHANATFPFKAKTFNRSEAGGCAKYTAVKGFYRLYIIISMIFFVYSSILVSIFLSQVYKERLCPVFLCRGLPDCCKRGQGPALIPLLGHPAVDVYAGVNGAIHVFVHQLRVLLQDQGLGGVGGCAGYKRLQFGIGFHVTVLSA